MFKTINAAIIIFIGLGFGVASCINTNNSQAPELSFQKDSVLFGNVRMNDSALVEFTFTNTGNTELRILDVGVGCGCTTVAYDTIPYKPGAQGKIRLKFLSTGDTGAVLKSLVVKANTNPSLKVLYISGKVSEY